MVDKNYTCLNREEHFLKGDLFDTYNYQVFINRKHRQKNVVFSSFDGIIYFHDICCDKRSTHIHYNALRVSHFKTLKSIGSLDVDDFIIQNPGTSGAINKTMSVYSQSQKKNMKKIASSHPLWFKK